MHVVNTSRKVCCGLSPEMDDSILSKGGVKIISGVSCR